METDPSVWKSCRLVLANVRMVNSWSRSCKVLTRTIQALSTTLSSWLQQWTRPLSCESRTLRLLSRCSILTTAARSTRASFCSCWPVRSSVMSIRRHSSIRPSPRSMRMETERLTSKNSFKWCVVSLSDCEQASLQISATLLRSIWSTILKHLKLQKFIIQFDLDYNSIISKMSKWIDAAN